MAAAAASDSGQKGEEMDSHSSSSPKTPNPMSTDVDGVNDDIESCCPIWTAVDAPLTCTTSRRSRKSPTTCTSREASLPTCTTTKRRRHPPRRRPTESTKRLHSPSWLTNNTVTAAIRRRPTMLRRESRRIIRNQRPAISFNRPESSSPPSNNNNNNGRASVSSPSAASSSATPSPQFPHQSAGVNLSVAASAAAETGSSFNSNCRRRLDYSAPRT